MTKITRYRTGRETVVIAYGANPGGDEFSPSQLFGAVVKSFVRSGLSITKFSRPWRSLAWPEPRDPVFTNLVLLVQTDLGPHDLMSLLHGLERDAGRVRDGRRNAPRPLDLDIIAYGDRVESGELTLPHPRAHERGFVMGPLCDVWPQWVHPVLKATARELYERVTVGRDAYALDEDWSNQE